MSARKGGSRANSRRVFSKSPRTRGKISLTKYFMPFKEGDKALLHAEPAVQKSLYHRRFHSKVGTIQKKRGNCYEVEIADGGKKKTLIVHPVHLRKL